MLPIFQTINHSEYSNYLQACIASILEKPINLVPNFTLFEDLYWEATIMWFNSIGHNIEYYRSKPPNDGSYYITSLKFPEHMEGIGHAVIMMNGIIVHDPIINMEYSYDNTIIKGYYNITKDFSLSR